jgi:hypothetical protein
VSTALEGLAGLPVAGLAQGVHQLIFVHRGAAAHAKPARLLEELALTRVRVDTPGGLATGPAPSLGIDAAGRALI